MSSTNFHSRAFPSLETTNEAFKDLKINDETLFLRASKAESANMQETRNFTPCESIASFPFASDIFFTLANERII
jgi:hypothetical protein